MNSLAPLFLALLLNQDVLPRGDVTEAKWRETQERIDEIQRLSRVLKELGDPIKPASADEEFQDRCKRALRILKGRAYLLVRLREEYQQALEKKYELESLVEEYKRWIEDAEKRQG